MEITRDMALRLRDIFDEKMFSVQNWMHSDGRSRIDHWLDQLGVKCQRRWRSGSERLYPATLPPSPPWKVPEGFVFVNCRELKNQLMSHDLLVPLELAEMILVLGDIPPEKSESAR